MNDGRQRRCERAISVDHIMLSITGHAVFSKEKHVCLCLVMVSLSPPDKTAPCHTSLQLSHPSRSDDSSTFHSVKYLSRVISFRKKQKKVYKYSYGFDVLTIWWPLHGPRWEENGLHFAAVHGVFSLVCPLVSISRVLICIVV